jgi:hypothetical protein
MFANIPLNCEYSNNTKIRVHYNASRNVSFIEHTKLTLCWTQYGHIKHWVKKFIFSNMENKTDIMETERLA